MTGTLSAVHSIIRQSSSSRPRQVSTTPSTLAASTKYVIKHISFSFQAVCLRGRCLYLLVRSTGLSRLDVVSQNLPRNCSAPILGGTDRSASNLTGVANGVAHTFRHQSSYTKPLCPTACDSAIVLWLSTKAFEEALPWQGRFPVYRFRPSGR